MAFDLGLTSDQQALAHHIEAFFAKECPTSVVRAAEPLGFDAGLWSALRSIEAPGMGVGHDAGGGGAEVADLLVVCEALGRAIAPVPLVEHTVAARLYPEPDIVSGDSVATVSLRPAGPDGTWRLVPAGAVADVVIGIDGGDLVAVRSEPPGVAPRNHSSSPLADRSARHGERTVMGPASSYARALDEWRLLTAAALVGLGAAALDLAVGYVLDRHQFGRPVGSFQVIQHGLADCPGLIDGGRLLAHKAAWALDRRSASGTIDTRPAAGTIDMAEGDVEDPAALAAMAFVHAAEAAALITDRSLHYHGGYGFAEEYDIQLYYRRARGWVTVLDDPARERLRLADLLWPDVGGR